MPSESGIRIFRREKPVSVLGPGLRAVVWVQGCSVGCKNCIVPESWAPELGEEVSLADLAEWILAPPYIDGVTFSGGEPMEQAGSLLSLVQHLRGERDLGIVCYTGYRFEELQLRSTPEQSALLRVIDLLIDGPYIESLHADLLWRASTNQRLIPLTSRYQRVVEALDAEQDRSAGLEFFLDESGSFAFAGVPPRPKFRSQFAMEMAARGIKLVPVWEVR